MAFLTDLIVPGLLLFVSLFALAKKQEVYTVLTQGASRGLRLLVSIVPALILLLTAVQMLRASGALAMLCRWLAPVADFCGIPVQTLPLVLVRPISGSAALAVGSDLMAVYGTESVIGRTAAVMLGSSETTFYTICVYFGAANIRKTRYAIPAALVADLTGFVMAAISVKIFFSS